MRLTFLTPSLIGSIFGGVYHLTNRQVVLMGLTLISLILTRIALTNGSNSLVNSDVHFFKSFNHINRVVDYNSK